jgi:hypothetical protein
MRYSEEMLYQNFNDEISQELGKDLRNSWKRHIDHFLFLEKMEEERMKFHILYNTINPNIQFTMEYSDTSISFLDIKVVKNEINVLTDIFYKTIGTYQ